MTSSLEKGYTLLELLIVIALMTGLVTVMFLNSANSRSIANLDRAARQLESALIQAQSYGNSGVSFVTSGIPDPTKDFDKGYGVYVTTNPALNRNKQIIIYGGKFGTNAADKMYTIPGSQDYEVINLEGGVVVSRITTDIGTPNQGQALFRRGQEKVSIYGNNTTACKYIKIELKAGTVTKNVYAYETGLIYIE